MTYIKAIYPIFFSILFFSFLSALVPCKVFAQKDNESLSLNEDERRKLDHFFYEALNAKAQGRYDEAFDLIQHCYALDSTNANILIEMGTFYNVLQQKNEALSFFRKAVHYDSANYYYNMMLASLSKELELKQEVVDLYRTMVDRHPDKPELQFELAIALADNGELQEAVDTLNKLEQNTGLSDVITMNKYRLYSLMNKKEEAFEEIQQIIEKNRNDPRYFVLMGDLYLEDNQPAKAIKYYEQAKEIDKDFPALILSLVNYYEKTDNKAASQAELQQAIMGSSLDVETKLQLLTRYLGILQQQKQDLKQANQLFMTLFEQYPNNTQLNMIYGNVLLLQGDKTGAMKQLEIYIKDNPADPAGYDQMIRIVLPDEDMEKLKRITTEALKHLPKEPQFYYYLGAAYYQQGKYKEALSVFEEGVRMAVIVNPLLESDFHGQIGDLNYFLGNKETAFLSYEKALKFNPQNVSVLNNYSYYLSLEKKNLDKAEQMSGITIKAEPMNPTFLDTYGWVLYEQGAYTMAKIYIEKAIEYSQENPSADVLEHYGDVLYKIGEKEKALEQWKKAYKLNKDSKKLKKKIRKGKL